MGGKRYKENDKKGKSKIIIIRFLLLIFVLIMIYSGIKIVEWIKENTENTDILEDIQETIFVDQSKGGIKKYNVDFASLKQKNADTVAWIKVNGTNIEYPVVKTTNNDYYMTHSFNKSYNSAGWAFMDYKNKFDGKDNNIVIYAHNRRDGSMFGTLKNILNEEWQDNKDNMIIPFITEKEKEEYRVFSVYQIEKEDYYITTNFANDTEFRMFIDKIKSRSKKNFEIDVSAKNHILTLSTCADDNRYRVVLHAVKLEDE